MKRGLGMNTVGRRTNRSRSRRILYILWLYSADDKSDCNDKLIPEMETYYAHSLDSTR